MVLSNALDIIDDDVGVEVKPIDTPTQVRQIN